MQLTASIQKCQLLKIGRDPGDFSLSVLGSPLRKSTVGNNLGILVGSMLSFDDQYRPVVLKASCALNISFFVVLNFMMLFSCSGCFVVSFSLPLLMAVLPLSLILLKTSN